MPLFETYSHRKRLASRKGEADVYTYDEAPTFMREQICLALVEGVGIYHSPGEYEFDVIANANNWWEEIDRICHRELETYHQSARKRDLSERYFGYIKGVKDIDDLLSAIEVGCVVLSVIEEDEHSYSRGGRGAQLTASSAIKEINGRFEQYAFGYQFENRQIIRVDSKVVHAEIIKPALSFLTNPLFSKAEEDFMAAHRNYRAGEYKDCVTAANRAYESALKAICDKEHWEYEKGARASDLVTKVNANGLFTHDFDQSFNSYVAMLKTGLPSVRNNAGGHGEGLAAASVTPHIARFALNLTATNIIFLAEAYEALEHGKKAR